MLLLTKYRLNCPHIQLKHFFFIQTLDNSLLHLCCFLSPGHIPRTQDPHPDSSSAIWSRHILCTHTQRPPAKRWLQLNSNATTPVLHHLGSGNPEERQCHPAAQCVHYAYLIPPPKTDAAVLRGKRLLNIKNKLIFAFIAHFFLPFVQNRDNISTIIKTVNTERVKNIHNPL